MATWRLPYRNLKTAQFFADRMTKPWLPKVIVIEEIVNKTLKETVVKDESGKVIKVKTQFTKIDEPQVIKIYDWEDEAILKTIGDDELFNAIGELTRHHKKPFDLRPTLKKNLRPILLDEKKLYQATGRFSEPGYSLEAVNLVRQAVGLSSLKPAETTSDRAMTLNFSIFNFLRR